jgi:large subunit ribosomal protein L30
MAKLKIKQVKSGIDRPEIQKRTLMALGFKKLNQEITVEDTPQILGMIDKVRHLVDIEKI